MSLIQSAERFAMRVLPPGVTRSLQQLKQRLPLRLIQAAPVVQIYIDDAHTRSFVGFNNFYSCLLAETETAATVVLRFYAPSGALLLTHERALSHCAADAVDVHALFEAHRVRPRRQIYRELGQVSAQFFVFFRDRDTGSVGQTHPLSSAERDHRPSPRFVSSQLVSTAKLRQLIVFQYNPSARAHTLEHALVDAVTGTQVAAQRVAVPALGSAQTVFTIAEITNVPPQLSFCIDSLPSGNSKPMLRRVFDGGMHSVSHA